ncbi:MAG: hypothetical protein HEQ39_18210 [Rhizobacter sp.]
MNTEVPLTQSFGGVGTSHVRIRSILPKHEAQHISVNVYFDSQAKEVSARMDQKRIALQNESSNGTLSLALQLLKEPGQLAITLPPSINTLTVEGVVLVELLGDNDTGRRADFALVLANCYSDVTFGAARIDSLRLEQVCSDPHVDEEKRHSTFSLESGLDVSTLNVDMKAGKVAVSEKTKVGAATLRLGNEVEVQAPAGLLRQARWLQP